MDALQNLKSLRWPKAFREDAMLLLLSFIVSGLIYSIVYYSDYPSESSGQIIKTSSRILPRIYIMYDTYTYIMPIENLIECGQYQGAPSYKLLDDYRMPGLVGLYGPLYWLTKRRDKALQILTFLYVFFASLVPYLLAKAVFFSFGSKRLFYITYFASLIQTLPRELDLFPGSSETPALFFLVFGVYLLAKWLKNGVSLVLLLSSVFLTWSFFIRPVHFLALAVSFLLLFAHLFRNFNIKQTFSQLALFSFPFLVAESGWVLRNYLKYGDLRFTHASGTLFIYKPAFEDYSKALLEIWTGMRVWRFDSPMTEYVGNLFGVIEIGNKHSLPKSSLYYPKSFPRESLAVLIDTNACWKDPGCRYAGTLRYIEALKKEKPWAAYVGSRLKNS